MINFNVEVKCPYCPHTVKINCKKYASILSSSDKDNGMGVDTQWGIKFETVCPSCKKTFAVEGTIGEYPVDTIEYIDVKPRKI